MEDYIMKQYKLTEQVFESLLRMDLIYVKDFLTQSGFLTGMIDNNFENFHGPAFVKKLTGQTVEFSNYVSSKSFGSTLEYSNGALTKLSV